MGTSHAAQHLAAAAEVKGFTLVEPAIADLVFVSEDTPTAPDGTRDMAPIRALAAAAFATGKPVVITSQCEPGFSRGVGADFHQAETLRIKDAVHRSMWPEMLIVGSDSPTDPLPPAYEAYLKAFRCPVLRMTFEEAEFAKIAINMTLAAQVENTNRLASAAAKLGARWERIVEVLQHDSRIGPNSYLTPGRWQDSPHLVRDWRTLQKLS